MLTQFNTLWEHIRCALHTRAFIPRSQPRSEKGRSKSFPKLIQFHLWVLVIGIGLVGNGCLSRPALVRETFLFDLSAPESVLSSHPTSNSNQHSLPILDLRSVTIVAPFESTAFVYRTAELAYEMDPYAAFLVPPARSLAQAVRSAWRNEAAIGDVVEPGSRMVANRYVEIQVMELYGDFQNIDEPGSVLALRFVVFDTNNEVRAQREIRERVLIQERTARGVMTGWNEGLRKIVTATVQDLR